MLLSRNSRFLLQYYVRYKYRFFPFISQSERDMRRNKKFSGKKLQAVLNQFVREALRVVQEQNVVAYWSRPWTAAKREG